MSNEIRTRSKQTLQREHTREGLYFRPDVDIVERADAYLVTADLPGVDESHVHVRLEDGVLSIDAKLAVAPDPDWSAVYTEYRLGGFHREFTISDRIDAEKIAGRMRDGVLELSLPKADRHRPRQIEVRGG